MLIKTDKKFLKKISTEVTEIPTYFIEDFKKFIIKTKCLSLSAIQVGNPQRIFILKYDNDLLVFINPEIIEKVGKQKSKETCVSFPGVRVTKERSRALVVKALDEEGKAFIFRGKGVYAAAVEHEIDHLNGITIA